MSCLPNLTQPQAADGFSVRNGEYRPCGRYAGMFSLQERMKFLEVGMQQSPWQHQAGEGVALAPPDPALQPFVSGVAVGVVVVVAMLLIRRPGPRWRPNSGRSAVLSGWGDLFRFLALVVRGALLLALGILLLGRVLLWPSGRRW